MRVLTSDGSIVPVNRRFNFVGSDQMSGGLLGFPSSFSSSVWSSGTELISGAGGRRLFSSFYDIYRSNPWVFACVNLLSWGLSRFPLKVYEMTADGDAK